MAQVTVTINSREYAVACEDGQEVRIIQLARQLDEKAKLITQGSGQVNENMLLAMVGLLIADELAEVKKSKNIATPLANEAFDAPKVAAFDSEFADKIKLLTEQLKTVASHVDLM